MRRGPVEGEEGGAGGGSRVADVGVGPGPHAGLGDEAGTVNQGRVDCRSHVAGRRSQVAYR